MDIAGNWVLLGHHFELSPTLEGTGDLTLWAYTKETERTLIGPTSHEGADVSIGSDGRNNISPPIGRHPARCSAFSSGTRLKPTWQPRAI